MSEQELHEARKRFEDGQMTRRAALRKFGITAGAAFFSMFMLDDLARMAARRLNSVSI